MGNECINSNSSSNNVYNGEPFETMDDREENKNTIINRVWIVKKSITVTDGHTSLYYHSLFDKFEFLFNLGKKEEERFNRLYKNLFNLTDRSKSMFNHWSIILELSNNAYVNIQSGKFGFSLKEFNQTEIEAENIFKSIFVDTWGEKNAPLFFCFLGNADYEYEKLKSFLHKIKDKEEKEFEKRKCIDYNLIMKNCQNFCKNIEKILFGKKKAIHGFDDISLDDFFKEYFPKINIKKMKLKYEEDIRKKNKNILKLNMENINKDDERNKKILLNRLFKTNFFVNFNDDEKYKIQEIYCLKYDDYFNYLI